MNCGARRRVQHEVMLARWNARDVWRRGTPRKRRDEIAVEAKIRDRYPEVQVGRALDELDGCAHERVDLTIEAGRRDRCAAAGTGCQSCPGQKRRTERSQTREAHPHRGPFLG